MNLSVAIPVIKQSEGYSNTQIGLLTSLFFLTYTIGQLLSGLLGDHLRSKPLLVTGLLLSACCNLGCAFSSGLPMLFACWYSTALHSPCCGGRLSALFPFGSMPGNWNAFPFIWR